MANIVRLNAADPNQVVSAQSLSVLTAEPNTWLLIFTGIALQSQFSDDDFWGNTVDTNAHVEIILTKVSGVLLQAATVVSLADINEDGDDIKNWIVWDTWLELRENGDLVLVADTTVNGDSGFWGFSYQANAKIILDDASISGTIRWQKHSFAVPKEPPHFLITANSPLPQSGVSLTDQWQQEATGYEYALDDSDSTYYYIPYKIKGALLGKKITVLVSVIKKTFKVTPSNTGLIAHQISGPTEIHLTSSHRHQTDVNFELMPIFPPK